MAQYMDNLVNHAFTIASGQTVSAAIDLQGRTVVAMYMPSAFTGSTITFQTSPDNSTFQALYNTSNTQMSATVTQARNYKFDPGDLSGIRYLKLVSGSAEGADRTIIISTMELR